jgi:hypothetical protein
MGPTVKLTDRLAAGTKDFMKPKTQAGKASAKLKRRKPVKCSAMVRMLVRALKTAAEEAYQSEVVDTQMTESVINGTHESKADWIEERIESWNNNNIVELRAPERKP